MLGPNQARENRRQNRIAKLREQAMEPRANEFLTKNKPPTVYAAMVRHSHGRTNYEEYPAGTDLKNANSRLTIKTFTPLPGGGYSLTWDTQSGRTYRVERSSSLTPNQWIPLQTNVTGESTPKSYTVTTPGSPPQLFYRIAVPPGN